MSGSKQEEWWSEQRRGDKVGQNEEFGDNWNKNHNGLNKTMYHLPFPSLPSKILYLHFVLSSLFIAMLSFLKCLKNSCFLVWRHSKGGLHLGYSYWPLVSALFLKYASIWMLLHSYHSQNTAVSIAGSNRCYLYIFQNLTSYN